MRGCHARGDGWRRRTVVVTFMRKHCQHPKKLEAKNSGGKREISAHKSLSGGFHRMLL